MVAYCHYCEAEYDLPPEVDHCPNCSSPLSDNPPAEPDPDADHERDR